MITPPPADLHALPGYCWGLLKDATTARKHPWHTPAVATSGADREGLGTIGLRTVVLRECSAQHRQLTFHTDRRSPKLDQLRQNPEIAWLFYDAASRQQLRCLGMSEIHEADELANKAWQSLHASSRALYAHPTAPGAPEQARDGLTDQPARTTAGNDPADRVTPGHTHPPGEKDGAEHFALVTTTISAMDWLELGPDGHRRAIMRYASGTWQCEWVAP